MTVRRDHQVPYVSLGRPIEWADIVDEDTQPIDALNDGQVHCYRCDDDDERKLTRSTGVFTRAVLCPDDAPVWLCLEHMPCTRWENRFDWLKPETAKALEEAVKLRDREVRAQQSAGVLPTL